VKGAAGDAWVRLTGPRDAGSNTLATREKSMAQGFDRARFLRDLQAAQQKAEAEWRREVDRVNRENQRRVDAYNRQTDQHNQRVVREHQQRIDAHNRQADQHNRRVISEYNQHVGRVNAHNQAVVADLNHQLRAATSGPRYTLDERALADRIQQSIPDRDEREWDIFLSYARIDGAEAGGVLRQNLEQLGVRVWFDEIAIIPGKSQALQMDKGLQKARAGVVLLTPAYLVGRFWTQRELGALLHKETLIPVLHGVSFEQVAEYSGILPDLAGFETARDPIEVIAEKITAAVLAG
jgi:hypothetical protein